MSYELTAWIGRGSAPAPAVPLPQDAWLIPIVDDSTDPQPPGCAGRVAYVTAEFFGGAGQQSARVYENGAVVLE